MVFGRRRKEEKVFTDVTDCVDARVQLREQLQEVDLIGSAAEKLIRLEEIRTGIEGKVSEQIEEDRKSGRSREGATLLVGNAAVVAASIGVSVATGGMLLPFMATLVGGVIANERISAKAGKSRKKKLEAAHQGYLEALEAQKALVLEMEARVLADHLDEVAKSPLRESMFKDYPGLRARFADAAARKLAAEKPPANDDDPPFKSPFDSKP